MAARNGRRAATVGAAGIVALAAALFYGPALRAVHGYWPIPLDDAYIYFDFARSAAIGHAFEWLPGNGYSSGSTSVLYPLVLAPAYLVGIRGAALGAFAAGVALAALVDFARSLARAAPNAPPWFAAAAAALVVSVPLLDWSWFSGMETALFAAILGRTLAAASRACRVDPVTRPRAQWAVGLWAAALLAMRPESVAFIAPLGIAVAHACGSLSAVAALARTCGPAAAFGAAQLAVNRALTGEWAAAGAVRKLLWSNPYASDTELAAELVRNVAVLRAQAFDLALGGKPWSWTLPALAVIAAFEPRTRRLAIALGAGTVLWILLVSFNTTARFQNLRYAAPALAMLVAAAALGVAALVRRGRVGAIGAAALASAALVGAGRDFPRQVDHFARASRNIAEQHGEVARRLAQMAPPPRRVLVGDAGAIPYLSGAPALDGLGLGGYRGLPFARASVHGVGAVIELLERLDPEERPDVFALYPSWFPELAESFGRRIDAVRIADNVICAADEKVIFAADWSALAPGDERDAAALDRIDVADLVDERAHAYELPGPGAGWVVVRVLALEAGPLRFDAGRIIPEGRSESFAVAPVVARGPATLVLRTDPGDAVALHVDVHSRARAMHGADVDVGARPEGAWATVRVPVDDIGASDRVTISVRRGVWKTFTAWLVR